MEWRKRFSEHFPEMKLSEDESMSRHTTFRIGGNADVFAEPTMRELPELISYCRKQDIPYTILGNGSNVLVSDKGIRGVVISFGKEASKITTDGQRITAEAGALLSQTARTAMENELTGLEFAAGIPGTIGGAMLMNAGAYGGEMKDVTTSVDVLLPDGTIATWKKEELGLSYRHSRMMDEGVVILRASFALQHGKLSQIEEKMDDYRQRRKEKQPLEYPSAGSTFKRPEGYFAGKLIMDAGLSGYRVGGAAVSQKHCGFVINENNATAQEVRHLMNDVTEKVRQKFGVTLEPEVRFLGEF